SRFLELRLGGWLSRSERAGRSDRLGAVQIAPRHDEPRLLAVVAFVLRFQQAAEEGLVSSRYQLLIDHLEELAGRIGAQRRRLELAEPIQELCLGARVESSLRGQAARLGDGHMEAAEVLSQLGVARATPRRPRRPPRPRQKLEDLSRQPDRAPIELWRELRRL